MSHAGVGIGLCLALRSSLFRLQHREVALPSELFRSSFPYRSVLEHPETTLSEDDQNMWDAAVRAMADEASFHILEAQQFQRQVPRSGKVCLLPMVPASLFLSKLQKARFDLRDPALYEETRLRLLLLLARSYLTGIY